MVRNNAKLGKAVTSVLEDLLIVKKVLDEAYNNLLLKHTSCILRVSYS